MTTRPSKTSSMSVDTVYSHRLSIGEMCEVRSDLLGRPASSAGGFRPNVGLDTTNVLTKVKENLSAHKHYHSPTPGPTLPAVEVQQELAVPDKLPVPYHCPTPKFNPMGLPDPKSPLSKDMEEISVCQENEYLENPGSEFEDETGELNSENLADLQERYEEFVRSKQMGEWLEPAIHVTPVQFEIPKARSKSSEKSGSHASSILEALNATLELQNRTLNQMAERLERLEIAKDKGPEMHPVNRSAVSSYHQLLQPLHMLEPDRVRELTESSPYFPRAVVERPLKGFSILAEAPSANLLYLYPLLELKDSVGSQDGKKLGRALGSAKLEFSLPVFDSENLGGWAKEFARVLRITGQALLSHQELSDAIIVSMKNSEIKEHFESRLRECTTLKEFLLEIEALFPKFECEAEIRNQIKALKPIQNFPNLTQLAIFQARLGNLIVKLTPDSYSRH